MENVNIKPQNVLQAILFLSIQNNIAIQALGDTLLDIIAKDDDYAKANIQLYHENALARQDEVAVRLNALFGDVDLSDLLGNG